ncbi:1,4-alpha-glucan branching protein GlgB [Mucilaginibacter robiniae]|uniref:1,4-alpha-glucan branching enzyme GlgB n=2 Tax=Mucilaginibacter robiniae TaxID=2728022 RepID=A0A7L5E9B8_9SPHI|nr:1,4-alpha-glucan branching protein GlgB [Mucilaginibacter robiniae]
MAKRTKKTDPKSEADIVSTTGHEVQAELAEEKAAPFPESEPVKTPKPSSRKKPQPTENGDGAFPESKPVKAVKPATTKKTKTDKTTPIEASPVTELPAGEISIHTLLTEIPAKKARATKAKPAENTAPASLPVIPETTEPIANEQLAQVETYSRFSDYDINLFKAGTHYKLYDKLGSHVVTHKDVVGTYFAVWAPNAQYVSVIGNFNGWNAGSHQLNHRWDGSGIWEGFIPNIGNGEVYKYHIRSNSGEELEKGDPFALRWEEPPRTASIIADTYYEWKDNDWMANRYQHTALDKPYSVYEVHLGSWARNTESPNDFFTYDQIADRLVPYVKQMGFTHVEFMPIMEHPYYPSWGYQITGYFAATSRYGTPQQLMNLIEQLHQEGIGVILDWVPSHFPGDAHALYRFDGTHLYEHEDVRKGYHPDWTSYIFNYGRNEVKAFLISNALFWLDRYHADGLRVDGVASMLYLDYSRKHGEWEPNHHGGNENLEAIQFLKDFNVAVYSTFPDVQTIAEESTSFPGVSRPVYTDGLGFGMKWMMGWMHDTLGYFSKDPVYRTHHHNQLTFSLMYAFTENFMLPFSHDEVVYGKGSMINKMPGDEWQRFANLRLMYSYMFTHPGAKLMFMGSEFAQTAEWDFGQSLDWAVVQYECHLGVQEEVKALNHIYTSEPALYEKSFSWEGFEWIDGSNDQDSIFVYLRKGHDAANDVVVVLNMTPNVHYQYRVGVPAAGEWKEIFNSDDKAYWGSGVNNPLPYQSQSTSWHGRENSIEVTLPPLGAVMFKRI